MRKCQNKYGMLCRVLGEMVKIKIYKFCLCPCVQRIKLNVKLVTEQSPVKIILSQSVTLFW